MRNDSRLLEIINRISPSKNIAFQLNISQIVTTELLLYDTPTRTILESYANNRYERTKCDEI